MWVAVKIRQWKGVEDERDASPDKFFAAERSLKCLFAWVNEQKRSKYSSPIG